MHANRNGKRDLTKSETAVHAQKKTLPVGRGGQAEPERRPAPMVGSLRELRRSATLAGNLAEGGESITSRERRELCKTGRLAF